MRVGLIGRGAIARLVSQAREVREHRTVAKLEQIAGRISP